MKEPPPIDYAQRPVRHGHPRLALGLGLAGCVAGALATLLPLWPLWRFSHVPSGTLMRPMGLTFILGILAAVGLFIALPLSIACLAFGWRERNLRWVMLLSVLLSLSAMFSGFGLFSWIIAARHFVLEG